MRYYSTSELLELMDLVETMKDVVLHYICPRLDPGQQQQQVDHDHSEPAVLIGSVDRGQTLLESWKDQSSWSRIVKTYAKLGPKELMFYFENIYSYPRKRLISSVKHSHPNLTFDQESIQIAIRCALDERHWLDDGLGPRPSLAEDSKGGILDFDDERDEERVRFGMDASENGGVPVDHRRIVALSRYNPRGDDGSFLEDHDHHGRGWHGVGMLGSMSP